MRRRSRFQLSRPRTSGRARWAAHWALGAMLAGGQPLSPAVIVVEGDCTLADAITAANTDTPTGACAAGSGRDEIQLTGDVALSRIDNQTDGANGLPSIFTELSIEGNDFTIARETDAPGFRILHIGQGGSLTLQNTTLSDGIANQPPTGASGGAVFLKGWSESDLTLVDSAIIDSFAYFDGGAIKSEYGNVTLIDSDVSRNEAGRWGGAIEARGPGVFVTLVNSTLTNNDAGERGGGLYGIYANFDISGSRLSNNSAENRGGALANYLGNVDLTHSKLSSNRAARGGAIYLANARLTLESSTLSDNTAFVAGGAVHTYSGAVEVIDSTIADNAALVDGGGIYGRAVLTNTTISGNTAARGGGLFASWAGTTVVNSTFSRNWGFDAGGAIHGGGLPLTVTQTTLARNQAADGAGIFNESGATSTLDGVLLGDNFGANCSGPIADEGANLDDDGSCGPGFGFLTGLSFQLTDNGGPTTTHALLPGSSAIDAAADCGLETDQRGFLRSDGVCDSGAVELGASAPLTLKVLGICPGPLLAELTGLTPNGRAAFGASSNRGASIVPTGACAGVELALDEPILLGAQTADGDGDLAITRQAPAGVCGGWMQVLDLASCETTAAVQLPGP